MKHSTDDSFFSIIVDILIVWNPIVVLIGIVAATFLICSGASIVVYADTEFQALFGVYRFLLGIALALGTSITASLISIKRTKEE